VRLFRVDGFYSVSVRVLTLEWNCEIVKCGLWLECEDVVLV